MRNDDNRSEFYTFYSPAKTVQPLNVGGAKQIVILSNEPTRNAQPFITNEEYIWQPNGDMVVQLNYMPLPNSAGGASYTYLTVSSNDEYLYLSCTHLCLFHVWVIR